MKKEETINKILDELPIKECRGEMSRDEWYSWFEEVFTKGVLSDTARKKWESKWIPVSERLPEIDESNEFNKTQGCSTKVPVKESGELRFGCYNIKHNFWIVEGRHGMIKVTEWFDLPTFNY